MARNSRNFLVIFQPIGNETVTTMQVIDAWSSTGSIDDARANALHNIERYREKFGRGRIQVVEQFLQSNFWI